MSEITRGVIGMPFDMAMGSELSRRQFHSVAQGLLVENDRLAEEYDKAWRHDLNDKNNVEALSAEVVRLNAEIDRLKHEKRLLTEHNEFLASSDSRLAPELRAVKDALGLDFTASVSGEVIPLIERLRKLPTCWTEVLEQSEANDQLLDQVLELGAELDGYKQGAQVEADAGDEARAEVKALRKVAVELRGAAKCYNLHHCKAEQHAISEPCKVLARIDAAMTK